MKTFSQSLMFACVAAVASGLEAWGGTFCEGWRAAILNIGAGACGAMAMMFLVLWQSQREIEREGRN